MRGRGLRVGGVYVLSSYRVVWTRSPRENYIDSVITDALPGTIVTVISFERECNTDFAVTVLIDGTVRYIMGHYDNVTGHPVCQGLDEPLF